MSDASAIKTVTHVVSGDLWAGAEVQVYTLCKELQASSEVTPTAVVFNPGILFDKLSDLGIPVTLVDESTLGPLAMIRLIANHCRAHHTSVVHTHGFKENVLGIFGKELAKVPRSVRTIHGNPESAFSIVKPHKWLVNRMDLLLSRTRQDAVIAVSSQLERSTANLFPGKVHRIFNFIDITETRKRWARDGRRMRTEPVIGIIGRMVPVKRMDLFIHAIALVNRRGLSCSGIIVGTGPLESALRDLADDLGIAGKITFRGFVNPALSELRLMDILLMPSDHEGLPMTLLEALALEVPIIAHNVGGIPEALSDGEAGLLVDDHSPGGYARALEQLMGNPKEAETLSTTGLDIAFQHFDKTSQTQKYIDLYNQLSCRT